MCMGMEKNSRLGKGLNLESRYNSHTGEEYTIERELRRLHRGWGKHRVEEEEHSVYCPRLGKVVSYQKGKPRKKVVDKRIRQAYNRLQMGEDCQ